MNSSAFSAADMTTAAASGHRDGYQAGYADAVKAYETGAAQELVVSNNQPETIDNEVCPSHLGNKPAAAQEAVAYLDIGAGGYLDLGSNLPEVQLLALPKGRHALGIIGTYGIDGYAAAPVAAAPVDGRDVRSAIAGLEGSVAVGSDGEWVSVRRAVRDAAVMALRNVSLDCAHIYAAYSEAKASTPAAPGIDLREFGVALIYAVDVLRSASRIANAKAADKLERLIELIDASTKDGSDACIWADDGEGNWHTACGDIFTLMEGSPADNKMHHCPFCGKDLRETGTDVCVAVIGDSYEDTRSEARDAARYRWLRNHYEPSFHDSDCDSLIGLHGEDLDDAIDDEMQATSAEVGA